MERDGQEKDCELIRQVRAGRREAFRPLVEKYWERVKGLARRVVKSPELVEDICQETFLRAFEKIASFDLNREFAPWIAKIAINLVGEHFRKAGQRLQLVPLDERMFSHGSPEPCEEVMGRMLVDQCLERLPIPYRIIFILRHGMMFSYEEIAQVLDEPLGTIKVNLFRAREILRRFLTRRPMERASEGVK